MSMNPAAALLFVALAGGGATAQNPAAAALELLTYDELVTLSDTPAPAGPLGEKLKRLLNTPVVGQSADANIEPLHPVLANIGPILRVGIWNIERGAEFDLIRLALGSPAEFVAEANKQAALSAERAEVVRRQAALLHESDVLILNEVDLGMTRSDYRDVTRDLAQRLGMHFAFAVEFIEVDKVELGLEALHAPNAEADAQFVKDMTVDKARYKGLHGSAILSRYPIRAAKILRFRPCYDWYGTEKQEIAKLEQGRRLAADRLFLERVGREVRLGNRMALLVDLAVAQSPTGTVTVVNAHLENKCQPRCRQEQMKEILDEIRQVRNPVVLGGDLNTTGSDGAPMSISREVGKRVKNPRFWARQSITWFTPLSLPRIFMMPANYFKNFHDPTARSIPLIAPNPESGLFSLLEDFRFADGGRFDFQGDAERSLNSRSGTLSNSNERALKGFTTTFSFKRDFKGLVGRLRLDWVLVKPASAGAFAPHFGRTLNDLNEAVPDQVSDHHPITVDLPLAARR